MVDFRKPKVAICYDFDKTLSPKNMQDFEFIKNLGLTEEEFWSVCANTSENSIADGILVYMLEMIRVAKQKGIIIKKEDLFNLGKNIKFFDGVESWFQRINNFAELIGVEVEHYILSSGLRQIIMGTPIAKFFKEIFACEYIYDENNRPIWPAIAINYTNKTQFLYRINKGILNVIDDRVNDNMEHELRPIPFSQIIYIGDSQTDIPCMRLVMKNDGTAIGVYQNDANKKYLKDLIRGNKINFIMKADYTQNSDLEILVKDTMQNIKCINNLKLLNKIQKEN